MAFREIIGLMTAVVILAGVTYAIMNGTDSAKVLEAGSKGFADIIKAATGR